MKEERVRAALPGASGRLAKRIEHARSVGRGVTEGESTREASACRGRLRTRGASRAPRRARVASHARDVRDGAEASRRGPLRGTCEARVVSSPRDRAEGRSRMIVQESHVDCPRLPVRCVRTWFARSRAGSTRASSSSRRSSSARDRSSAPPRSWRVTGSSSPCRIFHELEPWVLVPYDQGGADKGNADKIGKPVTAYDADARAVAWLAGSPHCTGKLGRSASASEDTCCSARR